jgi:DNA (cytosine-5)-methyltransferase 1
MTGGCTAPCKGRFGHPEEDRTISVREAATIQTFPEKYRFETDFMDTVCDLVGNALPCDFAAQVSKACVRAYKQNVRRGTQ